MATTTKKTTTKAKTETKTASAPAFEAPAFDVKSVEDFWTATAEKAQEQFEKAQSSVEDMAAFHRENVEVMVESATIAQKNFEKIAAETTTFTQKYYEDSVAVAKETLAATNPQEAFELQTKFAKSAFEAYVGHLKTVGEMFQTSTKETVEPVNARVTKLWETAYSA